MFGENLQQETRKYYSEILLETAAVAGTLRQR